MSKFPSRRLGEETNNVVKEMATELITPIHCDVMVAGEDNVAVPLADAYKTIYMGCGNDFHEETDNVSKGSGDRIDHPRTMRRGGRCGRIATHNRRKDGVHRNAKANRMFTSLIISRIDMHLSQPGNQSIPSAICSRSLCDTPLKATSHVGR